MARAEQGRRLYPAPMTYQAEHTEEVDQGFVLAYRETRYTGRCKSCKRGATALVTQRTIRHPADHSPDRWVAQEGNGYRLQNAVYVTCADCERQVEMMAVDGHYKPGIACSDRCRNAVGPSCDCSCGGENHGCNH